MALSIAGVLSSAAADTQPQHAWSIRWEQRGPFESCLEDRAAGWTFSKAQLVVNEDPSASDLDDMDVALWAVGALETCESHAGHGNQTSEHAFSRHMAHWRKHIDAVVQTVRERVTAD
jgi:hypothetical protein